MKKWIKWAWLRFERYRFERRWEREKTEMAIRGTRGVSCLAVFCVLVLSVADADARGRRRCRGGNCYQPSYSAPQTPSRHEQRTTEPAANGPDVKEAVKAEPRKFARPYDHIALQKAVYMAERGIGGHHLMHLNRQIRGGWFEGTGHSSANTPPRRVPTCTPGNGRRLIGDAVCRRGGRIYRCRLWR